MSTVANKIILVTGATSGIGEVTARELARQGGHVIIMGRTAQSVERAKQRIVAATGSQQVDTLVADFASLQQVRDVAAEIHQKYERLDMLINNAGRINGSKRLVSADGNELTLATNYLAPFLLTSLLFDLLQKSPAARIINVASVGHQVARPDFSDFQSERHYGPLRVYGTTKLWNIMFTQELANRLRAHGITNVTTNSLHPGNVATEFGKTEKSWLTILLVLFRPFLISPEEGAQTTLYLATDERVGSISGGYFVEKKAEPVKSDFNTPAHNRRLWELGEQLTGTAFLD